MKKDWPVATVALMNLPPAVSARFAFSSINPNSISPAACIHHTSIFWTGWCILSNCAALANECVQSEGLSAASNNAGAAGHLEKSVVRCSTYVYRDHLFQGEAWCSIQLVPRGSMSYKACLL